MKTLARRALRKLFVIFLPEGARNSLRLVFLLDDRDRKPEKIDTFGERRVVVLAPHMDDEAAGCGGAIRRHALAGARVTVVFMTDGRRGNPELYQRGLAEAEVVQAENELVAVRKSEARLAAELLGVDDVVFLDAVDRELAPTTENVSTLVEVLRDRNPDLIYLPSMMDLHGDHWETNRVVYAALAQWPAGGGPGPRLRGYEVWTPVFANRVVDIDDVVDAKRAAIEVYKSQITHVDYVRTSLGLNAFRSIHFQYGHGHAEAFFECTPDEFKMLVERIASRRSV